MQCTNNFSTKKIQSYFNARLLVGLISFMDRYCRSNLLFYSAIWQCGGCSNFSAKKQAIFVGCNAKCDKMTQIDSIHCPDSALYHLSVSDLTLWYVCEKNLFYYRPQPLCRITELRFEAKRSSRAACLSR